MKRLRHVARRLSVSEIALASSIILTLAAMVPEHSALPRAGTASDFGLRERFPHDVRRPIGPGSAVTTRIAREFPRKTKGGGCRFLIEANFVSISMFCEYRADAKNRSAESAWRASSALGHAFSQARAQQNTIVCPGFSSAIGAALGGGEKFFSAASKTPADFPENLERIERKRPKSVDLPYFYHCLIRAIHVESALRRSR